MRSKEKNEEEKKIIEELRKLENVDLFILNFFNINFRLLEKKRKNKRI